MQGIANSPPELVTMRAEVCDMRMRTGTFVILLTVLALGAARPTERVARKTKAAARMVELPHTIGDDYGLQWDIQCDGTIGNGGGGQFSSAGVLRIDDRFTYAAQSQKAEFDAVRGEVSLPAQTYRGLRVSRRIAVNVKAGFCRWAEVLENPTGARARLSVSVQHNLGNSAERSQWMEDDKHNEQPVALAAGGDECGYVFFGGGLGTRVMPRMTAPEDGDNVTMQWTVDVPPRQTVVLMHAAGFRRNFADAVLSLRQVREADLLGTLPPELRRRLANYRAGRPEVAGVELLRGESWDLVELRNGDQFAGTIEHASFGLRTPFGPVQVKCADIAGMVAAAGLRPRQLLALADGQVIGGELDVQVLRLRLADGQGVSFPLAQVARVGWRRRSGDEPDAKAPAPMAVLRTGERLLLAKPGVGIEVSTRVGRLRFPAALVAAVNFAGDDAATAFHEVRLSDGTRISGLVEATELELQFAGALVGKSARIEVAAIEKLVLGEAPDEPDLAGPAFQLIGGDVIGGVLKGPLLLDAGFARLAIEGGQVKRLTHLKGTAADVLITLWDDSTIQGQLEQTTLICGMADGIELKAPLSTVALYEHPRPAMPDSAVAEFNRLLADLADADAGKADLAQEKLAAMGGGAILPLRQQQSRVDGKSKQRIGDLLVRLDESARRQSAAVVPPVVVPPPPPIRREMLNKD